MHRGRKHAFRLLFIQQPGSNRLNLSVKLNFMLILPDELHRAFTHVFGQVLDRASEHRVAKNQIDLCL